MAPRSFSITSRTLDDIAAVFDKLGPAATIDRQPARRGHGSLWTIHSRIAGTAAIGQGGSIGEALRDFRAVDPELSHAQAQRLGMIVAAGRNGESHAPREPVVEALKRRGLVIDRHCRANPRNRNWIATERGVEVDERRRAKLSSYAA